MNRPKNKDNVKKISAKKRRRHGTGEIHHGTQRKKNFRFIKSSVNSVVASSPEDRVKDRIKRLIL